MGKLLRLEVFNFKSYKGHHILQFGDSYFTSIIGPNGSGKSNSMDAISFVLGIKSSHLRSTQLKDLIYRGRVLKHSKIDVNGNAEESSAVGPGDQNNGVALSEDENPAGRASLRHDPTTAWVMAVYQDDAGNEQQWKRTIMPAGQSEYRINSKSVSAKDYNQSLENENILIKARNFLVFQGDIEAIASQSHTDLTHLVEQISGSLELKEDYERLKAEAELADEDYNFKLIHRRVMNSEIKQYQEQKAEADRFDDKMKKRDRAIANHILWKLYHVQQQIEESGSEIERHQEELRSHRRVAESIQANYDAAKRDQAKASREVFKLDHIIKEKKRELSDLAEELVPLEEKITYHEQGREKCHNRLDAVNKERDNQVASIDRMKKSLATVEKAQQRWDQDWNQKAEQSGKQLSNAELQVYDSLRGEVASKVSSDQMEVDKITRRLRTEEETAKTQKSKVDAYSQEIEKLESDAKDMNQRKSDLISRRKQAEKDQAAKKKELDQISSERNRNHQNKAELDEKLHNVLTKLGEADNGRRESEKESRMRETVTALKRICTGVRGRLHELCQPKQKKYDNAVGVVLGRNWDSVIVDSEATAKDCIQYLKDNRLGQATFIPLDTIQAKPLNPHLRSVHRGARLAVDTIEFDSALERAIQYACGSALICDDLQIAKFICFEKSLDSTAVTLDGIKITKGGLMTGGRGQNDKARRWDDAEVEKLRQLKDKFLGELKQLALAGGHKRQQEEETLQRELSALAQSLQFLKDEIKATDRNVEDKQKELGFSQAELKLLAPKYDQQGTNIKDLKILLETHQNAISKTEDKVFSSFCKQHGYKTIRDYESQQGTFQQEHVSKTLEFENQKSRLENQLSFEAQRLKSTEDRISKLEDSIKQDLKHITDLSRDRDAIQHNIDRIRRELDKFAIQLEKLEDNVKRKAEKALEEKRQLQMHEKEIDATLKQIVVVEAHVQKSCASRYTLLRKCRIEEIDIPLMDQSAALSALPLNNVRESEADEMDLDQDEMDGAVNEIKNYGIEIDFDKLPDASKADGSPRQEAELQKKIENLTLELDKMAPNMKAHDRLGTVQSRLDSTEKELDQARRLAKRRRDDFDDVKDKRGELFKKAFDHIHNEIDEVYRELTESDTTPGGKAYLYADDSEEPYLSGLYYSVTPPLKRYRAIEHLSGGEKTMAALALLFAVHSYQPSPFFVLDEVDAALDNANVSKLIRYITAHAKAGMQFIVISLKPGFFEGSQTLIGVMRDQSANSSRALTLDLRKYQP